MGNGGLSVLFFCCWKRGKSSGNSDANVALMGEVGGSVEVEMEVEAPTLEVEVELEAPEVEVEVEIEAPEVEIEVEIEAPEVEVDVEVPDVEVGANLGVEVDLSAPIVAAEAGGSWTNKASTYGAKKMGGMGPFCAFMGWFTFMTGIVMCSLFSYLADTTSDGAWMGWLVLIIWLAGAVGGSLFCLCSGKKQEARATVDISA